MNRSLLASLFQHTWFWVLTFKFYFLTALFLEVRREPCKGCQPEDWFVRTILTPEMGMLQRMGQQSLALGQANLYKQKSIGPSMVLQTGKASCCLPTALVVPAGSTVPVDKWRLLLSAAFPSQLFLMPKIAQTMESQTVPLKLSTRFSWSIEGENCETSF